MFLSKHFFNEDVGRLNETSSRRETISSDGQVHKLVFSQYSTFGCVLQTSFR
jgi:hypothetical protein